VQHPGSGTITSFVRQLLRIINNHHRRSTFTALSRRPFARSQTLPQVIKNCQKNVFSIGFLFRANVTQQISTTKLCQTWRRPRFSWTIQRQEHIQSESRCIISRLTKSGGGRGGGSEAHDSSPASTVPPQSSAKKRALLSGMKK
jgi:hypothetical protein